MELLELKQRIQDFDIPKKIVFIDNCHLLVKEYIKAFSKVLNKRVEHFYDKESVRAISGRFDKNNLIAVVHQEKGLDWADGLDINLIFIRYEDCSTSIPKVIFSPITRKQCLLYLENYLIEQGFYKEIEGKKKIPTLSRGNLEKLVDYFDSDIDQIMGEVDKLLCLEVKALDRPFQALFDCLPPKPDRLKCLPWYSGGAVDTAAVLYSTYLKKLKAAGEMNVPVNKQKFYEHLVKEAAFVYLGIISGTFGDYAIEYLRLIEKTSPDDMTIQWFPPIKRSEIGKEWGT